MKWLIAVCAVDALLWRLVTGWWPFEEPWSGPRYAKKEEHRDVEDS
jgi:hypothetical protein